MGERPEDLIHPAWHHTQATYIVDYSFRRSMIVQSQVKSDVVVCSIPLLLPELMLIVPQYRLTVSCLQYRLHCALLTSYQSSAFILTSEMRRTAPGSSELNHCLTLHVPELYTNNLQAPGIGNFSHLFVLFDHTMWRLFLKSAWHESPAPQPEVPTIAI